MLLCGKVSVLTSRGSILPIMLRLILMSWLALVASLPVRGDEGPTTVYRTVNEHGVVEFSDTPPPEGVEAKQWEIAPIQPVDRAQARANLEAMRETTDRLAAQRSGREVPRSPIVFLENPVEPPPDASPGSVTRGTVYLPPVYYPTRRPPHYPPNRPHPPLRPQAMPEWDRNSQLMRPITEQRLRQREDRR